MKFSGFGLTAALAATASSLPHVARSSYSSAASPSARILLGNSGHIYIADFYPGSKELKLSVEQEVDGGNSWMLLAEPNLVYAVNENAAAIRLFELDLEGNKLDLKTEKNASTGVVHLEFNADKTRMVGSAYGNGTIDVWNVEDGGLELLKTIKSPGELGPNEERQASPHPHQANLDPSGRYFAVNDLGTDDVIIIDSKDDAYEIVNSVSVNPGCGPRHGVFYPRGADKATHYIVACEMTNVALVYSVTYEDDKLSFKKYQEISTYGPDDGPKDPKKAAAGAVILAPNNEDLYITNRLTGHPTTDSIAQFKVADCGELTFHQSVPSSGKLDRMISFSGTAKHVFVGNQEGEFGLVALARGKDGKLNKDPVAELKSELFGEIGFGPTFVQQIIF
ncbi:hypothetical protein ACJ41O_000654 [Fusarium nematophilum]